MKNTLLASLDGRHSPCPGERAVYWPLSDMTMIYAENGFVFDSAAEQFGMNLEEPELILPVVH